MMDLLNQMTLLNENSSEEDIKNVLEFDFKALPILYETHDEFRNIVEIYQTNPHFIYEENASPIKNWLRYRIVNVILDMKHQPIFDCDSCQMTKRVFRQLGWPENEIDTIDSFKRLWTRSLQLFCYDVTKKYYAEKREEYENKAIELLRKNDILTESLKVKELAVYLWQIDNLANYKERMDKNIYSLLENFARFTHTFGNFMPCPKHPYNEVKGFHAKTYDFLDNMLIQMKSRTLVYIKNNRFVTVPKTTVDAWEKWFDDNMSDLFIEETDYSLSTLIENVFQRNNKKEFTQLLRKILKRIQKRGLTIIKNGNRSQAVQRQCTNMINTLNV